ncbi:hypothetical protein [Moorella sp. ACPs]|uniref:hypothetical protein n=1 Tax=Neomoorella carbonis TaxID=3062783 RepID=UPI003873A8D8
MSKDIYILEALRAAGEPDVPDPYADERIMLYAANWFCEECYLEIQPIIPRQPDLQVITFSYGPYFGQGRGDNLFYKSPLDGKRKN